MKLNKLLAVAVLSAATLLTACSKPAASSSAAASSAAQASSAATAASSEAAKKTIKFGLGYQTAFAQSYGAWGLDNTIVAAAFDADGKILDARVDVTQYKFVIAANAEDATKYDVSLKPGQGEKSKLELGTDYNMLGSSAIGKEVYEQMEAWADWTVGKTVAQVEANEADIAGCPRSTVRRSSRLSRRSPATRRSSPRRAGRQGSA